MYYDYSKIDSYRCPVKIVVSQRGLGKTFGKLKSYAERYITKKHRFIYVVETGEMVKELTRNNGEKFWAALLSYYGEQDTSRKRYFYNKITELKVTEDEDIAKRKTKAKIDGGTIKINGDTAGYVLDMNSFGDLKRNNFNGIKYVLIDEFISEKLDRTSLENPRKISSLIQSIGRLRDIQIVMLGNTVRQDDPILSRMGFKLDKYGFYYYYLDGKLFSVLDFVDPKKYPNFNQAHNASVAGKFAKMMGETHEEENKFISDLPTDKRLAIPCKYKKNGISFSVVRDDIMISLKELSNGNIACVPFSNRGTVSLYCLTEREQGYKLGYNILCNRALKPAIMNMLRSESIYYYSEIEYNKLKLIIKGD